MTFFLAHMTNSRLFWSIIICISITLTSLPIARAESTAGHSAILMHESLAESSDSAFMKDIDYAQKRAAIKQILQSYDSPMVDYTDSFITACKTYNIDCYLLPSIAGLESTFGQYIYPSSYNPFGWGRGYIMFNDWDESIQTVAKGLRSHYVKTGEINVYSIGPIYSESPTWAVRVDKLMQRFVDQENRNRLYFSQNIVEL